MAKLFMVNTRKGAIRLVNGQPQTVGDTPATRQADTFDRDSAEQVAQAVKYPGHQGRPPVVEIVELNAEPTEFSLPEDADEDAS